MVVLFSSVKGERNKKIKEGPKKEEKKCKIHAATPRKKNMTKYEEIRHEAVRGHKRK